ncbi:MAG: IS200/IS605 family transposase [Cyanobacteria bacterium REEB65]|nr:IS200/IS605 family transposase [Cyanobacteria bacterium REEB65]
MIDFNFDRVLDEDDDGMPEGPAVARITGRLARVDPAGEGRADLWLICEDDGYIDADGQPRPGMHQALKVHARLADLVGLVCETTTPMLMIACRFHRGRLQLAELIDVRDTEEPLPNARVPERDRPNKTDGMLIHPSELEKMQAKGGWISQAHSVYRIPVAWHLVTIPKYRARSLEGKAIEVQGILRAVAEAEGMTVLALAAEPDHCHVLLKGMSPKTRWSDFVGRWKAITSRQLKTLPGLEDFRWAVGYSLCSVAGGTQGAEAALAAVEEYILAQGDQSNADVDAEGQDDL